MKKINKWKKNSIYISPLSPGCIQCARGSKMVVLITGKCQQNCFYCPLSYEKKGKDRIFADEWELKNEKDIENLIQEAKLIEAEGAGITGGDPLYVWQRTKKYIEILKKEFGKKFHIHLYTSGAKNTDKIKELISAGLDEIRFHPPPDYWDKMEKTQLSKVIKETCKQRIDVALEIPVIPEKQKQIKTLILWANKNKIKWINLNELEFSETNEKELKNRGYHEKSDISSAVKNSEKIAKKIIKDLQKNNLKIGLHYCSCSFKDAVQLRNRIKRRAKNTVKEYEVITKEGTLIKAILTSDKKSLKQIYFILQKNHMIKEKYLSINIEKQQVETAVWLIEKIIKKLEKNNINCFMVEEYPTADHLEIEKIPLKSNLY